MAKKNGNWLTSPSAIEKWFKGPVPQKQKDAFAKGLLWFGLILIVLVLFARADGMNRTSEVLTGQPYEPAGQTQQGTP